MHPGLADLVGRVLAFELQTRIRGPGFWPGLVIYCVNIKLSRNSFDLQKQKPKLTDKSGIPVSLRNLSQDKLLQIGKRNIKFK